MTRQKFIVGPKRPKTKNIDNDLKDELFGGAKAQKIEHRFEQVKPSKTPKKKSLYVRDIPFELVEKLKNIVFHDKVHGDPSASQSKLIIKALEVFVSTYNLEVEERPDWVKQIEERKSHTKRKRA